MPGCPFLIPGSIRYLSPETSTLARPEITENVDFAIATITQKAGLGALADQLVPLLEGEATFWFHCPGGGSKKYRCEFNRDNGWHQLETLGWEGVRQVDIDEDWSALRFRKTAYIKQMARSTKIALSEEGKSRTKPSPHKPLP